MAHNPLDQFKIKALLDLNAFGYDISITNSSLLMCAVVLAISLFYLLSLKNNKIIPDKLQVSGESVYNLITDMINQNIGPNGKPYTPLIFTLFIFILFCNLFGMIPYSFTVTSHISVTFILALLIFLYITYLGFYLHGLGFLKLFLPAGTPLWLAPLMIIIEIFTYFARPVSLSLRLTANMIAGHVLLKVMAGFVMSLAIYLKIIPIPFIVILIGFEIFVAILQAYIFAILTCVYLNDAVNMH